MNLEELRTVQRTERQKDSLQHLRESFYRDVADYVADLKGERERVAAETEDPFSSPEVSRLTDEIETAEEVVESIYERRVGKVVKRATFAAAGMAAEEEGLTHEEYDLFQDLVARIEQNRESVLDTLSTGGSAAGGSEGADAATEPVDDTADGAERRDPVPTPPPDEPSETPAPDPDDVLAEAMGGATNDGSEGRDASSGRGAETTSGADREPDESSADATERAGSDRTDPAPPRRGPEPTDPDSIDAEPTDSEPTDSEPTTDGSGETADDRTTVVITRDVGSILGVDEREYDLATEDVVTLPTPNAEPLLERDAAERL